MDGGSLPILKAGEYGTIESINGTHAAAKRLADMGIVRIGGRCVGLGDAHQNSILLATA